MFNNFKKAQRKWKKIISISVLFAFIGFTLSFSFPLQYRADAQVLIISQTRQGVDPFTVARSAERIGQNLVEVMGTGDFFNKVKINSGQKVDWSFLDGLTEREKRKLWKKTVAPSVSYGTGVLNISTYHTDPVQAVALASAVSDALIKKGWEYVGGDVNIKLVNHPVATPWPVRPNIALNTLLGFILGFFISSVSILRK